MLGLGVVVVLNVIGDVLLGMAVHCCVIEAFPVVVVIIHGGALMLA